MRPKGHCLEACVERQELLLCCSEARRCIQRPDIYMRREPEACLYVYMFAAGLLLKPVHLEWWPRLLSCVVGLSRLARRTAGGCACALHSMARVGTVGDAFIRTRHASGMGATALQRMCTVRTTACTMEALQARSQHEDQHGVVANALSKGSRLFHANLGLHVGSRSGRCLDLLCDGPITDMHSSAPWKCTSRVGLRMNFRHTDGAAHCHDARMPTAHAGLDASVSWGFRVYMQG